MDKPIESSQINRDRRKMLFRTAFAVAVVALLFYAFRSFLTRKADIDDFHITQVERGDIQNTLTATGIVVPASEREINAPVETEIEKVFMRSGSVVKAGDLILQLDEEYTQLTYDQLKDELSLKRNNVDKLKLEYDKNLIDLGYQDNIKGLQLEELTAEVTDQKRLREVGGATAEEVEQAQLLLKIAQLEKKMLENELDYRQNVNVNEKRGLELEYTIQEKRLRELSRKLRETKVRAPQSGVITWINQDIGRKVNAGETLVRIANLDKFRVEASTSDRNSGKLNVGMEVQIKINNSSISGIVATILPEVQNNTVKFLIDLDSSNNELLRPNMRAEVYIITDRKENVVRVKNGPAFKGASSQYLFVVEGDKAVKRRITKGLANSEYVEVLQNLSEGERVIISTTEDFDHLNEFLILKK